MCSILGYIQKGLVDINDLAKMNKVLSHRGPDDTGLNTLKMFESDVDNVAIGFNRLSIRDLSMAGHQPMANADASITITFNGEIYNAEDFRCELSNAGYSFVGSSDTEVLLYLYEEYGIDKMLAKIDGMYAICIVDKKADIIYLVRDKLGEKPLYFYKNEQAIMWASEYKAFYEHPFFKAELEEKNISEYIMFRYLSDGATLLKNVYNIMPGSYLYITKDDIKRKKYWAFPKEEKNNKIEYEKAKETFQLLFKKSIESRLISDVEVGIQLSGGVDSSYLTKQVLDIAKNKIKTFSIAFKNKQYSEEDYMDVVVKKFNLDSFTYYFDADTFLESWIKTSYYFEAPMNHEGSLGLLYLNKMASENVKVLLCGEGADESMGGYKRFAVSQRCRNSFIYRIKKFIKDLIKNKEINKYILYGDYGTDFILSSQFVRNREAKKIYLNFNSADVIGRRKKILTDAGGNGLRKFMNYELSTYCQDLLMRADKVSMANSLEVRVPYLMPELIEYECSLPDNYFVSSENKDDMRNTKILLKDVCKDIYGEEFTYRKKRGFGMPLMAYFNQREVKNYIEQIILPGIQKRGIFNYEQIAHEYQKRCRMIKKGRKVKNNSIVNALWVCFSFEIWAKIYLDGNPNHCDLLCR